MCSVYLARRRNQVMLAQAGKCNILDHYQAVMIFVKYGLVQNGNWVEVVALSKENQGFSSSLRGLS